MSDRRHSGRRALANDAAIVRTNTEHVGSIKDQRAADRCHRVLDHLSRITWRIRVHISWLVTILPSLMTCVTDLSRDVGDTSG
jgi:hypothetical protein